MGAGHSIEQILDDRQDDPAALRVALPQKNLRGEECTFEPEATLGAFTSCLLYAIYFTATATDLNPAAPWQVELYAADLEYNEAGSYAHRQRVEAPMRKFEMRFQPKKRPPKIWRNVE